ncbi:glycosyltransferase family 4 protein [Limosilactobacillus albertensis]|uniref:Glycosyltransferase family 4 protein n=1 Tax=Limosilactobacillus albertensis TaxID=2759752 RepID=A0A839HBG3_9LACO|nr:glycosyltransferase family 4 protein [Limosilactobacillus albertensis]MBB1124547.1 glycosyltransferase family 4 protein [Limosilactobacillus albertensis]MCD7123081.1 glycosyltransferase family 4 protein [Limosilactobacillus albertensis]
MKKYICEIGPGNSYPGGILTVINSYINSSYLNSFNLKHIVTASKRYKFLIFITGISYYVVLCLLKQVQISHIHMSERGSCTRAMVIIKINNFFGIPTIVHSHGSEIVEYYNSLSESMKKKFRNRMRDAKKIIVLTPGWREFWGKIVDSKNIVVIPNYVKIPKITKNYYADNKINLLFLGYIGDRKGTYDLIDAIKLLVSRGTNNIILRIAGNGEIEKCKKIIKEKKLEEYIKVIGWANAEKKDELLRKSDILILPSHFESFGIVVLEAMSYKLPVICGDKGFTKELITSGKDGVIAETGNPESIAKAICSISKNISTFGKNGFTKVSQNFSEERVLKQLSNLYSKLLK